MQFTLGKRLLAPLLCLPALIGSAWSQDDSVFFHPPKSGPYGDMSSNQNYQAGHQLGVKWKMPYKKANVYMWQPAKANSAKQLYQNTNNTGFQWTVDDEGFDLNGVNSTSQISYNTFYFYVYDADSKAGFASHYFNISSKGASSSTQTKTITSASASTSTSSTSNSGFTSASTPASASASASATTDNDIDLPSLPTLLAPVINPTFTPFPFMGSISNYSPSDYLPSATASAATYVSSPGLTSSQKTALGLGLGIGIPALLLLIGAILWMIWRRKRIVPAEDVPGRMAMEKMPPGYYESGVGAFEKMSPTIAGELPANTKGLTVSELDSRPLSMPPVELPAHEVRR